MAKYEDQVLHDIDGIEEYDNPLPAWLMAILWGSVIFSILYLAFYSLNFGDVSMEGQYRSEIIEESASVQIYFNENPIIPPKAEELLAGALDPKILKAGKERFFKSCASCHGPDGQGLIGPNLCDDRWIHGGKVTQIFNTIVRGVPAKGMSPWGRAIAPDELSALTSYIRSLQGSEPEDPKEPEGERFQAEDLPKE